MKWILTAILLMIPWGVFVAFVAQAEQGDGELPEAITLQPLMIFTGAVLAAVTLILIGVKTRKKDTVSDSFIDGLIGLVTVYPLTVLLLWLGASLLSGWIEPEQFEDWRPELGVSYLVAIFGYKIREIILWIASRWGLKLHLERTTSQKKEGEEKR